MPSTNIKIMKTTNVIIPDTPHDKGGMEWVGLQHNREAEPMMNISIAGARKSIKLLLGYKGYINIPYACVVTMLTAIILL